MNPSLSLIDLYALSPLLILLLGTVKLLLVESFTPRAAKKYSAWLCFAFIILALYASFVAPASTNPLLTPWLKFDSLARFFSVFFLLIGLGATLLASSFFERFDSVTRGEYFFLLLSC
ncbi:MAG TPA: NADH-quinone oxidoreductase subunit N, partial [Parachlamydiaceae bacterium]|nr:NADH-quinone oxidoreductase subunit N [Parachlamydiaceae bacterium]